MMTRPDGPPIQFASCVEQFQFHQVLGFFPQLISGRGTFGKVHLTRYRGDGRVYALKEIHKAFAINANQIENTWRERTLLLSLDHPLITKCYRAFQSTGSLFMVLEFVIGGDLWTYLRAKKTFNEETTRFYAAEALLALEFLHSKSIIYRDLKPGNTSLFDLPENILLSNTGHIKLADFGFAKLCPDGRTSSYCGTPEYTAPEIFYGAVYGKAVDWWSYGVLIYEMLAGFPPFYQSENPDFLRENIMSNTYAFPSSFKISPKDLIKKFLVVIPEHRWGSQGTSPIRTHSFFRNFDWAAAEQFTLTPPIIPQFDSDCDGGNFAQLPREVPLDHPVDITTALVFGSVFDGFDSAPLDPL